MSDIEVEHEGETENEGSPCDVPMDLVELHEVLEWDEAVSS